MNINRKSIVFVWHYSLKSTKCKFGVEDVSLIETTVIISTRVHLPSVVYSSLWGQN